ncbi:hypothetical protein EUX98_g8198 [Antrodiella citrinella]|uniref:Uncharacterized protein n=1 Tax=Antrodiella citrinella TaxID=2447956 RepID=A0A4S4MCA4_9APHY|nr:hypothetical protein EUX98_g8198 [Antrodiella citrinella]
MSTVSSDSERSLNISFQDTDDTVIPPMFKTHEAFFTHLGSYLRYAAPQTFSESALYGYIGFLFTMFCSSATVTEDRGDGDDVHYHFGCFSQMQLKKERGQAKDLTRIPDFVAMVFHRLATGSLSGHPAFLVEVKRATKKLEWTGKNRTPVEDIHHMFLLHFPQLLHQARCCRKLNPGKHKKVYGFLIIDVWFAVYELGSQIRMNKTDTGDLEPLDVPGGDIVVLRNLDKYCVVYPTSIFDADFKNFNPEFLEALRLVSEEYPLEITPHSYFLPPPQPQDMSLASSASIHTYGTQASGIRTPHILVSAGLKRAESSEHDLRSAAGDYSWSQESEEDDEHCDTNIAGQPSEDNESDEGLEVGIMAPKWKGKAKAKPDDNLDLYQGPELPLDVVHSCSPVKTRKRPPTESQTEHTAPSASRSATPTPAGTPAGGASVSPRHGGRVLRTRVIPQRKDTQLS